MQSSELLQAGYRYALALTHDRHEAEDLVHDAWLKLHERSRLLRGRAYFLRTVRNLFIDRYRRNRMILLEPLSDENILADPTSIAPEVIPQLVSDDALNAALMRIRPEEREVLCLNAVEKMTAAQIARHTGRSRNTVLSLIHRGKTKLQRILAQPENQTSAEGS